MTTTRSGECKELLLELRSFLAAVVSTASIMVGGPVPAITEYIARIDTLLARKK